jgi:hypothetical protein
MPESFAAENQKCKALPESLFRHFVGFPTDDAGFGRYSYFVLMRKLGDSVQINGQTGSSGHAKRISQHVRDRLQVLSDRQRASREPNRSGSVEPLVKTD